MIVLGGRRGDQVLLREVICLDLDTLEWKYLCDLPFSICAHAS